MTLTESDIVEIRMRHLMRDQSDGGRKLFDDRAASDIASLLGHIDQIGDWEQEYQDEVDEAKQEAENAKQKMYEAESALETAESEKEELEKEVERLEEELEKAREVAAQ